MLFYAVKDRKCMDISINVFKGHLCFTFCSPKVLNKNINKKYCSIRKKTNGKNREKKSSGRDIVLKQKIKKHQFTPFFLHCLLDANFLIQNFFYTDKTVAKAANFIISFVIFLYP